MQAASKSEVFAKQLELYEPSAYIDQKGPGYFAVFVPSSRPRQKLYETILLVPVIEALDPTRDTYISQAIFTHRNRRVTNLMSVGLAFADLDTYRRIGLADKSPEEQTALLMGFCEQDGIPAPSITLFSGRGLQVKWLLDEALEKSRITEWNEVQLGLVKMLNPFAADINAKDASRVLRVVRTINTKSGEIVRVVHLSGVPDCPARYDFSELQRIVRERFPQQPEKTSAKILQFPVQKTWRDKKLSWDRLCDLQKLWEIRGPVPEGLRETSLFWQLNFLMLADPVRDLWQEAQHLASQIGSAWFTGEVERSTFSTLYRKAQEARSGVRFEYQGRNYPPGYTPRSQTLIDIFRITSDEERQLKTIISSGEKVRRRREKRWSEGVQAQAESLSQVRPWEALGISRAWWYRLKQGESRQL